MGTEDEKNESLNTQRDAYDAAVLQFLNQEITTSAKTAGSSQTQSEDVDALVENLLSESMNSAGAEETSKDTGIEDLDLLFAKIFRENKPAPQTDTVRPLPAAETRLNTIAEAPARVDRLAESVPVPGPIARPEAAAVVQAHAAASALPPPSVVAAIPPAPLPAVPQAGRAQEIRSSAQIPAAPVETKKMPVFGLPQRKPFSNIRIAALAAAFLIMASGVGIILYKGTRGTPPAVSGPTPAAPTPASSTTNLEPSPTDPVSTATTESKPAPGRAGRNLSPSTPAAGPGNGAPPRDNAKPAPVAQPPAQPAGNAANTAAAPPDAAVKPASTTTAPVENAVINPPQRIAEPTPPPAAQPQPVPEPPLASLIPKATANLEDPAGTRRPAIQPPPQPPSLPRTAIPAGVISRVLPSYPELARKTHTVGTVVVEARIDEKGKVTKATALSGPPILRTEAENAVMRWVFRPATLDGIAVASTNQVSIVFK